MWEVWGANDGGEILDLAVRLRIKIHPFHIQLPGALNYRSSCCQRLFSVPDMAPTSTHSLTLDKGNDTVKVDDVDVTTLPPDHRPEILRQYSPEQLRDIEKKLVRKVDIRCLPILIFLFLLNILDRNAIANARLSSLEEDLGLSDGKS